MKTAWKSAWLTWVGIGLLFAASNFVLMTAQIVNNEPFADSRNTALLFTVIGLIGMKGFRDEH